MATLFITHPACLNHLTPPGHPERPDRLRAIERVFASDKFQSLVRAEAPTAEFDTIALCHPMDYVTALREASPSSGLVQIDADTSMSPGSFEAALRAAGGGVYAVDEVMAGRVSNAFVATRPPGHHTETARPMGFCLFNNAAIAARHAQKRYGIDRAAVVDFDVHHGNGSQDIFWSDKTVMYCSTHQMPLYPGMGLARARRARHGRQCAALAWRRGASSAKRLKRHPSAPARLPAGTSCDLGGFDAPSATRLQPQPVERTSWATQRSWKLHRQRQPCRIVLEAKLLIPRADRDLRGSPRRRKARWHRTFAHHWLQFAGCRIAVSSNRKHAWLKATTATSRG
jgi:hypothetical protein